MNAAKLRVLDIAGRERPYRMRMPFRFGVTTATGGRQAVVRVVIEIEGREAVGYSAEALGAKWFDKDVSLTDADNHDQLRKSLELAAHAYLAAPPATAFDLFAGLYQEHVEACRRLDLNPLIASYGQSLVDRAILDALCRGLEASFYASARRNLIGLRDDPIAPELAGMDFGAVFADVKPASSIDVRHTVGLADPIVEADVREDDRVADGLPQSLEAVVAFYGNRYFKLKISGQQDADLDRLRRIADVLDRSETSYSVTLDGNEQFADAESIAAFWQQACQEPALRRLTRSTLFVEQPIARARALSEPVAALASLIPVIIDESDGVLSAFPQARALGYAGVSSKACKGVYKSIINHARCRLWNEAGEGACFMSAEDLTCEPGTALQQDLALVNLLGLTHVERNAHHFIDGFGDRPASEGEAFLAAHPDLYHVQDGRTRLRLSDGRLEIGSLDCVGFGARTVPQFDALEPMPPSRWSGRKA